MNTSKSLNPNEILHTLLNFRDPWSQLDEAEKQLYRWHKAEVAKERAAIVEAVEGLAPKKKPKMSYAEACKDFKLMEIAIDGAGYNRAIDDFLQAIKERQ